MIFTRYQTSRRFRQFSTQRGKSLHIDALFVSLLPSFTPAMEQQHELHIKNMVCPRCIMFVKDLLEREGFTPLKVELGLAVVREPVTEEHRTALKQKLHDVGFELLDDQQQRIADEIRTAIIERVHYQKDESEENLSEYLSERLRRDYSALSKLFTEINGTSIEKYYVAQRVERVKELLTYGELTVSEIAHKMHYSSVAHLSAQFRNVTGISPTAFRQAKEHPLKTLDEI